MHLNTVKSESSLTMLLNWTLHAERGKCPSLRLTVAILVFALLPCFSFGAETPEILINRRLADQFHIQKGDIIELAASGDMKDPVAFRVSAVYEEKADPYQVPLRMRLIKMHLSDAEKLTGKKDQLDIVSIRLKKGARQDQFVARLNGEAIGFTAYSADELAKRSSSTFQVVSRFHRAIALITMMAGAIFIFALVLMRVEDQRKNLAILSVTGISKRTILKALMLESTFFAFLASLLGAGFGWVSAQLVNLYYRHYYQTTLVFADVTPHILFQAVLLSFVLGIAAGTFSWIRLRSLAVLQELGR